MNELQWRTEIDQTAPGEQPSGFLLHIETTVGPFNSYERAMQVADILLDGLKRKTK